jgi:hypothetical protein
MGTSSPCATTAITVDCAGDATCKPFEMCVLACLGI